MLDSTSPLRRLIGGWPPSYTLRGTTQSLAPYRRECLDYALEARDHDDDIVNGDDIFYFFGCFYPDQCPLVAMEPGVGRRRPMAWREQALREGRGFQSHGGRGLEGHRPTRE